jgi:hypothetical protein
VRRGRAVAAGADVTDASEVEAGASFALAFESALESPFATGSEVGGSAAGAAVALVSGDAAEAPDAADAESLGGGTTEAAGAIVAATVGALATLASA